MACREYGAAIFSPGLSEVLLVKHGEDGSWAFPFTSTTESDVHVVAATSAVRHLLGVDIGDKISRAHWIEVEFPQTGALVRLYVALGVRPDSVTPSCAPGASARWHRLTAILPPVNAILRHAPAHAPGQHDAAQHAHAGAAAATASQQGQQAADATGSGGDGGGGGASAAAEAVGCGDEEGGGDLVLEPGIAPFLAKLKALLNKHPEWRISQLDPHLTALIQQALAPPAPTASAATTTNAHHQQHEQQAAGHQTGGEQAGQQAPGRLSLAAPAAADGIGGGGGVIVKEEPQDESAAPHPGPLGSLPSELEREMQRAMPDAAAAADPVAAAAEDETAAREAGQAGARAAMTAGGEAEGGEAGPAPPAEASGEWRGPRPQEYLAEYCRMHGLPEPCYSLVVKKSARRPLLSASCLLPHLGVALTPDMHVPGGMPAACQAAALAALLWLDGALPADGGEWVRVVPVGWPPLLSEARGESWQAAQAARRAGARRELDGAQKEALLREMDKKRQRLVAEAAELERLMAALRGGGWEGVPEPELARLTASLGLGPGPGAAAAEATAAAAGGAQEPSSSGLTGLAGSVTMGLQALQFRSGSGSGSGAPAPGGRGGSGRAPGTKRPREDGATGGGGPGPHGGTHGGEAPPAKNVVMELKELCDRRRWPQPQYAYTALPGGPGSQAAGAAAVLTLPAAAGLREVSSGPQANRKRAKEAAAAAALAQLSALGLK